MKRVSEHLSSMQFTTVILAVLMLWFTWKDLQVPLKRFTPPKGMTDRDHKAQKPGVGLIISRNPVKLLVFILFPITITGIGVYMVMTWRSRPLNK